MPTLLTVNLVVFGRPVPNYLKAAVDTVLALHREGGPGDTLIFLTGQEEVEKVAADLK